MRRLVASMLCVALLVVASPARAEGWNNLLAGINGLIAAPLDPVLMFVDPPENMEELPGVPVTNRIVGLGAGVLMMVYRVGVAVLDIVLFPFWVFETFSPEPPFPAIPNVEYES